MKTKIISLLGYNKDKINAYLNDKEFEGKLVERDVVFGKTGRFTVTNDDGTDVNKFFILLTCHESSMKTEEMEGCKAVLCLDFLNKDDAKSVMKKGRERVEKLPPFKGKDEKEKKKMYKNYRLDVTQNVLTQTTVNSAEGNPKPKYEHIVADDVKILERILTLAGIDLKYIEQDTLAH